jgi:hypothetical protein
MISDHCILKLSWTLKTRRGGECLYPSYLGGEDWEDHSVRPGWAKTLERSYLNKQARHGGSCNASYSGGVGRRSLV